jgi:hypothetical protein
VRNDQDRGSGSRLFVQKGIWSATSVSVTCSDTGHDTSTFNNLRTPWQATLVDLSSIREADRYFVGSFFQNYRSVKVKFRGRRLVETSRVENRPARLRMVPPQRLLVGTKHWTLFDVEEQETTEKKKKEEERDFVQIIISSNLKRNEGSLRCVRLILIQLELVRFSQPPFRHPNQLPA